MAVTNIVNNDDDEFVTITLPSPTGDGRDEYQLETPTPEQLILLAIADNPVVAVMAMLKQVFDEDQYNEITRRMGLGRKDPARLQLADLTNIVEQLMEARSGFPTEPQSDSSSSPTSTGRKSTGRVHSPASTRTDSASAAS